MKPLVLTIGEPAGIGPDIVLKLWQTQPQIFAHDHITVIGNRSLLIERAEQLKINFTPASLSLVDIPLSAHVIPGELNVNNATFVMDMLTLATQGCLDNRFSGMVTAPIHKGILNKAGFAIAGHTDFLSQKTQCDTVMMLMTPTLKVALLTDHIALREVPDLITEKNLTRCLDIIIHDFKSRSHRPRILVCGLNPHAGEQGYLGSEEINNIIPVIKKFQQLGHDVMGPVGADVAFTEHYRQSADIILAMYHDQGLPALKYSSFDEAINVTLGLPFVRTSVDHGTALDIAGSGKANTTSLLNAILYAQNSLIHQHERIG